MRTALCLLFIIWASFVWAQNNANIHGKVFSSERKPLDKATVSIVSMKDSLVITYALTNLEGKFDLGKIPSNMDLRLFISHVGHADYEKELNLKPQESLTLDSVILSSNTIEEVFIQAVAPIRLNGDTLEYKADYFKTRPNANVEELLQLLPGLQVNLDGSILYQGRAVSSIRVNNKDFFAHDFKIATKNLDASLIDVVQVIKDKGESNRIIIDDNDLPIVINLKMKKEFLKANFGKLYAGAATRERYESGVLINAFRDTLQVSFIGFANNIGRSGFDYSELNQYGGGNRQEGGSVTIYGAGLGLFNQNSAGLNVNYDIGKKLKMNLTYNFLKHNFLNENTNSSNSFYNEINEASIGNSVSDISNYSHTFRTFTRYRFNDTTQISADISIEKRLNQVEGLGNNSRWRNLQDSVLNSNYTNLSDGNQFFFNYNLYFEKKLPNRWIISLRNTLAASTRNHERTTENSSKFHLFQDSLVNQGMITNNNYHNNNLNNIANLQIPITKKINTDLFANYQVSNIQEVEDILNRINSPDYVNRNDVANNKGLLRKDLIFGTKWSFRLINQLNFSLGLKWLNTYNEFEYFDKLDKKLVRENYWLPESMISYKGITLRYNQEFQAASFENIVVVNNTLAPTVIQYASPFFNNVLRENISVYYNKYFNKSKLNFSISFNHNSLDKGIGFERTYNVENGFSTSKTYQSGGTKNIFSFSNLSKTIFQKNDLKLDYSLQNFISKNQTYSKINDEENLGSRLSSSFTNKIDFRFNKKYSISPFYEWSLQRTNFKIPSDNFKNVNNNFHSLGASLLIDHIKSLKIESTYKLVNQVAGIDNSRKNLHLINLSCYYPVMKKGELKLSVYDLLNQSISNSYRSNENTITFNQSLVLRQYFMLSMVYKFLETGKK